jgi:uncharacterized membrane protein (TIGR01666 family)
MDYLKEYKTFITGHRLATGVRITVGVVLPAVLLNLIDLLQVGIVMSLGAMCVSGTDNPGPIHHRRNGMLICTGLLFVVSLLTGWAEPYPVVLGILIFTFCFLFSMIAVFGTRATSIGVTALVIMVLSISRHYQGWEVVINALYVLAGAIWYTLLSLLLYNIRPYKLAQQALGECILSTADYLRMRASFYSKDADVDEVYRNILEQQIVVHEKQDLVRDLLFKTRSIVKESTHTSRTLLILFIDTVDVFERAMTAYYDYGKLQQLFHNSEILEHYRTLILELSNELDNIGIAVQGGGKASESARLQTLINDTGEYLNNFRDEHRTPENIEGFIILRNILRGIEDLASRIKTLQRYSTYDRKQLQDLNTGVEYEKFVTHQDIDIKLLRDNLSFKSNTFRHAVRVSVATIIGYIISKFLPFGHGYWILLTIIVIVKPTYSLSKKRNYERLFGTIAGAAIGLMLLYFVKDNTTLFVIMLVLMIGTYSFLRSNYLVSVIFMTPYVLLLFHLLYAGNTRTVLTDRIIDTGIGSVIAFFANFFLVPVWEKEHMKTYLSQVIEDNMQYFRDVASAFTGKASSITQYKMSRKQAFVALANLSDAFSRMLSEPKSKQQHIKEIHQLVVLNHILTSHIATLSYFVHPLSKKYSSDDFIKAIEQVLAYMQEAKELIDKSYVSAPIASDRQALPIEKKVEELMELRRKELQQGLTETDTRKTLSELKPLVDQFNFITGVASDIRKTSFRMVHEQG